MNLTGKFLSFQLQNPSIPSAKREARSKVSLIIQKSSKQSALPLFTQMIRKASESGKTVRVYSEMLFDIGVIESFDSLIEDGGSADYIFVDATSYLMCQGRDHHEKFTKWIVSLAKVNLHLVIWLISPLLDQHLVDRIRLMSEFEITVHNLQRFIDAKHDFRYIHLHSKYKDYLFAPFDNDPLEFLVELESRKKSGKYQTECSRIVYDNAWNIAKCETIDSFITDTSSATIQPPPSQPQHQVSFNLSLTKKQEESRSKVSLPFMQAKPSQTTSSPAIFYSLDDADDFDDEDPDADLEI